MKRLLMIVLLAGCVSVAPRASRTGIDHVLDDWHAAAAVADEARYFSHMSADAVFLGTDGGERWTRDEFRAFAHPYFAKGKAWTFTPVRRNVTVRDTFAWFDEDLNSASYGACRGTGVLHWQDGRWLIEQYNLEIPIPNAIAKQVVQEIRANRGGQ